MFSVQCYAALHGYKVVVDFDDKFKECAVHNDVCVHFFISILLFDRIQPMKKENVYVNIYIWIFLKFCNIRIIKFASNF